MNIFSYILMFFYLYIIFLKRNKKDKFVLIVTLSAICSMFIEAGYFIMIGDKEIDYGDFGLIVSFVWALYILSSTRIKKKNISLISLACLFALMGMIGLIIWPYGEKIVTGDSVSYDRVAFGMTSLNYATLNIGNIIKLIFLVMYYVICLALYEVISNEQKKRIMYILYSAIKIFLVFGIFEWVFAYVFHNEVFRNAVNLILGNGSQFLGLISRNDSYMLQGLCREASHYLFCLFISSLVLYIQYKKYKDKKALIWLFILGFIAVFATSLSAVLYLMFFVIFVIMYKANENNTSRKRVITLVSRVVSLFFLGLVAIGIIFTMASTSQSYTLERIYNLPKTISILFSDVGFSYIGQFYSSELIRLYSIICTIKNLFHRPLFGFGMGTTICHGSSVQFLTDAGIIGMVLWYKIHARFGQKNNKFFTLGIIVYIMANIFSSMYLVPFVGVSAFVSAVIMDEMFRRKNGEEFVEKNEKKIKHNYTYLQ